MNSNRYSCLFLILFALITFPAFSQLSKGGVPPGFTDIVSDHLIMDFRIDPPDTEKLLKEDEDAGGYGVAERVGVLLPVNISPSELGSWQDVGNRKMQWRMRISAEGARHLAFYFSYFNLPEGAELFVYNVSRTHLIGAFTHENNHDSGLFATELVAGESIIIELLIPRHLTGNKLFTISDVLYAYREQGYGLKQFGSSGACNVNINCSEGNDWQDQKRGVVKINSRVGASVYRCSGSLINNTRYDFLPYIFTADHCARSGSTYSTEQDFNQWVFYFNYEAESCTNPAVEPLAQSLVGATLKANVGGGPANMGSDFCLVLLNNNIPPAVIPYFNGWSRANVSSPSGVGIHHPSGDIRKISTYTNSLVSTNWDANTPNMYWQVRWSETPNGHGVTEGGSSGSPLFNNEGYIVGQLTGGQASCNNRTAPDYYGKFSVSWESNGSTPDRQLKPWLDPENTGVQSLRGSYNTLQVVSFFAADTVVVQRGGQIGFRDFSIGQPTEWHWFFQGGEPAESTERNPGLIAYNTYGRFDVKLIVKNEHSTDTLLRKKYIRVIPGMFPNPTSDHTVLMLGKHDDEYITIQITDLLGIVKEVREYNIKDLFALQVDVRNLKQGVYILTTSRDGYLVSDHKLIVAW